MSLEKPEFNGSEFMRKINLILNSAERSAYVCVWRILNQDAVNLKRRTDPIIKEKNRLQSKIWRKNNPTRFIELSKKSYNKNITKRRNEKQTILLDPIKHEKLKATLRKSYDKHKVKRREEQRIQNNKKRIQVLLYYSKGVIQCSCCGEMELEFLSIDHIEGREKFSHPRHIGGSILVNWLIKNNYPDGFRVQCFNCNFARGKINNKDHLCPHERIKNKTNMMMKYNEFQKKKEIKVETESNILLKTGEFN